jgi:hypothetical protein
MITCCSRAFTAAPDPQRPARRDQHPRQVARNSAQILGRVESRDDGYGDILKPRGVPAIVELGAPADRLATRRLLRIAAGAGGSGSVIEVALGIDRGTAHPWDGDPRLARLHQGTFVGDTPPDICGAFGNSDAARRGLGAHRSANRPRPSQFPRATGLCAHLDGDRRPRMAHRLEPSTDGPGFMRTGVPTCRYLAHAHCGSGAGAR